MFSLKPNYLYHVYKEHLSDYRPDLRSGQWHPRYLDVANPQTGERTGVKPLYVFSPKNIGEQMCIDDKAIGHEGFTVLSNAKTGKIALLLESCKYEQVSEAMLMFGEKLHQIKTVSCDMSATYLKVIEEDIPNAKAVVDKFHVMQYVYDAVLEVRTQIRKELIENLSKGKVKTIQDQRLMEQIERLKHCRYRLTQSPQKWTEQGKQLMQHVFEEHPQLRNAYNLAQKFKIWYEYQETSDRNVQKQQLRGWFEQLKQANIPQYQTVVKMLKKHEHQILNYFISGQTNAKAERLNGKIKRFVANNYGIKDKDFALYRIAKYFG
jgi:transposase